jgi:hypothetical protein
MDIIAPTANTTIKRFLLLDTLNIVVYVTQTQLIWIITTLLRYGILYATAGIKHTIGINFWTNKTNPAFFWSIVIDGSILGE